LHGNRVSKRLREEEMQAPTRDPIRENRIRPPLSLELPEEFRSLAEEALGDLFDLPPPSGDRSAAIRPLRGHPGAGAQPALRVSAGAEGWCIEGPGVSER